MIRIRSARLAEAVKRLDRTVIGTREELDERDRKEILWWREFRQLQAQAMAIAGEVCPRCGSEDVIWVSSAFLCNACKWKGSCCEGMPNA